MKPPLAQGRGPLSSRCNGPAWPSFTSFTRSIRSFGLPEGNRRRPPTSLRVAPYQFNSPCLRGGFARWMTGLTPR